MVYGFRVFEGVRVGGFGMVLGFWMVLGVLRVLVF